jgi:hypothetical protein
MASATGLPLIFTTATGGITYGAAFPDSLSKSTTTEFRSLRTWCATGCASTMRTRDAGTPIDSYGSTDTAAIGLFAFATTVLATSAIVTLRKSTSTVTGSGRVNE